MSFLRDLQVVLKGIQRGWRVGWTSQKVQGPTPPVGGSLGNLKTSKVHGGGGPGTRGGVLQSDARITALGARCLGLRIIPRVATRRHDARTRRTRGRGVVLL